MHFVTHMGPFYLHGLTLIPALINDNIHDKVSDEISISKLQQSNWWSLGMDK